jgi:hypothetical protein
MENISVIETKKGTHFTSPSEDNYHCFFCHKGIVHFEFLKQGLTVNQHCYLEMLASLLEAVRRRPELRLDAWTLHHDSAPAHDALAFWEFLTKKLKLKMKLDHPRYSPGLAPRDFRLFPNMKSALKGYRFSDIADIQGHATIILKRSSRNVLISGNTVSRCVLVCKETTLEVSAAISV